MSRALNIDAAKADVLATCTKHKAAVSTAETLLSGGTRVVLMNSIDAATIAKAYKSKIITGPVARTMWVRNP